MMAVGSNGKVPATDEDVAMFPRVMHVFHKWLENKKSAGTALSYMKNTKKLFELDGWSAASMATEEYVEQVKEYPANKRCNNAWSASLKQYVEFWKSARPDPLPEVPEDLVKIYSCKAPAPKNGEDASGTSTAEAGPPARKRAKAEPEESTDSEVAGITATLKPDEEFRLISARCGKAWVIIPRDVDCVVLDKFSSRVEASGWSCSQRDDHRYTYRAAGSQVADLVLYSNEGRLLVKGSKKDVALKVADLYVYSWLGVEPEAE
mmetsp:Transcript_81630/g.141895  ORF Transcript_81630/g.141895 Transcript_81630/m.141895 type:complete len:263 (+) Transcript_81630:20-808(+)